jgi:hypothetical protein
MAHSSTLRLVARTDPFSLPKSAESLTTSTTSAAKSTTPPTPFETETLGNKLQRLMFLSPGHLEGIEALVDRILTSLENPSRSATLLLLLAVSI